MHYACKMGYLYGIKLLLSKGAKIEIKNNEKQSALHICAKYGRYSSCLELLKCFNSKSRVNEKDSYGKLLPMFKNKSLSLIFYIYKVKIIFL
jgi:ankyrin repeat protein